MTFRFPCRLYAIADPCGRHDLDPVDLAEKLLAGGARLLQLRWKEASAGAMLAAARAIRERTRARGAVFLINDRTDVALACGADGVHLGQTDLPVSEARRLLGPDRIIGLSTHDTGQAERAAGSAADYLAFGPLFGTATKDTGYDARGLAALRAIRQRIALPLVAIGGLREDNAREAIEAGADAVAMISELCLAPDVEARVRRIRARLGD